MASEATKTDDGGPAFPNGGIIPTSPHAGMNGMSLRDWFAGQALAGMLANPQCCGEHAGFAKESYLYADAMLAARKAVTPTSNAHAALVAMYQEFLVDNDRMTPSQQESILKPAGWMHYRYPFIYGQPDTRQFPLATWRSAANWLHGGVRDPAWVIDHIDQDVPMLIEDFHVPVSRRFYAALGFGDVSTQQVASRVLDLERRGLVARSEDIWTTR